MSIQEAIDAINILAASPKAAEFYREEFAEGEYSNLGGDSKVEPASITFLFPVGEIIYKINISKADDGLLIYKLFDLMADKDTSTPITSAKEVKSQTGGYRKKRRSTHRRRSNRRRSTRRHK